MSAEIAAGINYSIILTAACYIEGTLEFLLLRSAPFESEDELVARLLKELRDKITATTGLDRFNELFELVTGTKAYVMFNAGELWVSVKMLFHFRNMLAHGRAVKYDILAPGTGVGGVFGIDFTGGYKAVEDYLLKKDLLPNTHLAEGDDWFYFSDVVADHFWQIAQQFAQRLNSAANAPDWSN